MQAKRLKRRLRKITQLCCMLGGPVAKKVSTDFFFCSSALQICFSNAWRRDCWSASNKCCCVLKNLKCFAFSASFCRWPRDKIGNALDPPSARGRSKLSARYRSKRARSSWDTMASERPELARLRSTQVASIDRFSTVMLCWMCVCVWDCMLCCMLCSTQHNWLSINAAQCVCVRGCERVMLRNVCVCVDVCE